MTKHTKRTLLRKSKIKRNKLRKNKSLRRYKQTFKGGGASMTISEYSTYIKNLREGVVFCIEQQQFKNDINKLSKVFNIIFHRIDSTIRNYNKLLSENEENEVKTYDTNICHDLKNVMESRERFSIGYFNTNPVGYYKIKNEETDILKTNQEYGNIKNNITFLKVIQNVLVYIMNIELIKLKKEFKFKNKEFNKVFGLTKLFTQSPLPHKSSPSLSLLAQHSVKYSCQFAIPKITDVELNHIFKTYTKDFSDTTQKMCISNRKDVYNIVLKNKYNDSDFLDIDKLINENKEKSIEIHKIIDTDAETNEYKDIGIIKSFLRIENENIDKTTPNPTPSSQNSTTTTTVPP